LSDDYSEADTCRMYVLPKLRKSAIFNLSDTVCLYSNHLSRIRPSRHIVLPEWILFYFRSRWLKGDFEEMCHKWINQAAVGNEKIKKLEIPIPAIEIQRKRIEELKNISYVISEIKKKMNSIGLLNRNIDGKFKKLYNQILASAYSGTW
jgi:restriction endonuclease S subunit